MKSVRDAAADRCDHYVPATGYPASVEEAQAELYRASRAARALMDDIEEQEGDATQAQIDRSETLGERARLLEAFLGLVSAAEASPAPPDHSPRTANLVYAPDLTGRGTLPERASAEYVKAAMSGEPLSADISRSTGFDRQRGQRGGVMIPTLASTTTLMPGVRDTRSISGAVYPSEVLMSLGIGAEMVRDGAQDFRWLRPASSAMTAEGANVTVSDSRTDSIVLKPRAAIAGTSLTVEATAVDRRAGQALIDNLRASNSDLLEAQILGGSGSGTQVTGLMSGDPEAGETKATGAASTYAGIMSGLAGLVDGKFARTMSDLSIVMSSSAYGYLSTLYPTSSGQYNLTQVLAEMGVSIRVSAHAPAEDSTSKISKLLVRRGSRPDAYAWPLWMGSELLRAPLDQRGTGVVARQLLVMVTLWNFALAPSDAGVSGASRGDFLRFGIRLETVT